MSSDLVDHLRRCAEDPMWPDHCEMSKRAVRAAADRIEALEAALAKAVEALRPFAETEPVNIWRETDEDAGNYVLTENQFRAARAAMPDTESRDEPTA
jgi:hypothetical protein